MKTVSLKILIEVQDGQEHEELQNAMTWIAAKASDLVSWQPVIDRDGNDIGECHLEISDVED